jgi:hypothetical protein
MKCISVSLQPSLRTIFGKTVSYGYLELERERVVKIGKLITPIVQL